MTHTVGQVADLLDASGSTVRRWATDLADHLSGGANPGRGTARQFTDDDLRVLGYVASRTTAGVPIAEIARELPTAPLPSLADLGRGRDMTPDNSLVVGLAGVLAGSQDVQRQIAASLDKLTDIADLRAELEELRQRVASLETQRHSHRAGFPYKPTDNTSD